MPRLTHITRQSPEPTGSGDEPQPDHSSHSGHCPDGGPLECASASGHQASSHQATDALWQYLQRIESGLDQIDARIDRLYIALGGGTVLLAAIGLGSAFIVRGG